MYLPSLYFCVGSYALSYFHPRVTPHLIQYISRTVWLPVVIWRSQGFPSTTFTTPSKRYALPCCPLNALESIECMVAKCVLQVEQP